ncbi:amino acid ABC transporter permease [Glaciimonas soli]|uniref:ABC transporter permease subunit n=1 Tax=Glaciimonas soli TaxID=2590999 RepID=A0A843YQF2_9BURK|nr:amino acid ABC transporter permease [Glaciimonas soli]MQR00207.1 ABC transporter permease subunit [Glaciimonas soli]
MNLFWEYVSRLLHSMWTTIELAFLSLMLAFLVGLILAIMRVGPSAPLRTFAACYVELMRMTPILAFLIMVVWGLPKLGWMFSEFTSSLLVLGFYTAAWISEAFRSGIDAIPQGQIEAARSIGMTFWQILRHLVIPQAARTVIPSLSGLVIVHIKSTSVAAVVGVLEITETAQLINVESAQWLWFIGAIFAYMSLTIPTGLIFRVLERKMAIRR